MWCWYVIIPSVTHSLVKSNITLEFIHLLSAEANEICEKESKKTIAPEHILTALKVSTYLPVERIEPSTPVPFSSWALRST